MDLYTLTDTFLAKDVVDEYISAIWTERYSSAGEVQLVVPATLESLEKLKEGTFLALRGSQEVMLLESASIEDRKLTVVGNALPMFLNERYAWFKGPSSDIEERVADFTADDMPPGEFISEIVNLMVINPSPFTGLYDPADIEWDLEVIPHLTLGAVDTSGEDKPLTAIVGPLYDSIKQVSEKEGVGISLYLESADPIAGYSLKFKTYRGKDLTSDQEVYPLVRLSPEMDSLSGVKEVRSINGYKNVAYVYYKGIISKHLAEPTLPEPEGFARRILVTNAEGEPVGHKEVRPGTISQGGGGYYTVVDAADTAAFREQNARDALANHNYIRAIDGQTSPNNDYQYGVHYGLGDIIELEGITGTISKARVTEFIRSEDQEGEKQYPTISVINPTEGE